MYPFNFTPKCDPGGYLVNVQYCNNLRDYFLSAFFLQSINMTNTEQAHVSCQGLYVNKTLDDA